MQKKALPKLYSQNNLLKSQHFQVTLCYIDVMRRFPTQFDVSNSKGKQNNYSTTNLSIFKNHYMREIWIVRFVAIFDVHGHVYWAEGRATYSQVWSFDSIHFYIFLI